MLKWHIFFGPKKNVYLPDKNNYFYPNKIIHLQDKSNADKNMFYRMKIFDFPYNNNYFTDKSITDKII